MLLKVNKRCSSDEVKSLRVAECFIFIASIKFESSKHGQGSQDSVEFPLSWLPFLEELKVREGSADILANLRHSILFLLVVVEAAFDE